MRPSGGRCANQDCRRPKRMGEVFCTDCWYELPTRLRRLVYAALEGKRPVRVRELGLAIRVCREFLGTAGAPATAAPSGEASR